MSTNPADETAANVSPKPSSVTKRAALAAALMAAATIPGPVLIGLALSPESPAAALASASFGCPDPDKCGRANHNEVMARSGR
jgi:hypothetical protein